MSKLKRVVVYIEEDDYKRLRSKLIMAGKSVSSWIRDFVKQFLSE